MHLSLKVSLPPLPWQGVADKIAAIMGLIASESAYNSLCECPSFIAHSGILPTPLCSMLPTHAAVSGVGVSCWGVLGVLLRTSLCHLMTVVGACSAAVINWGLLVLVLYALYYIALEPVAGASWGALLGIPMWLTATAFCQHVPHAWAWALGLHILSWFAQVGHAPLACPSQLCASALVPACERSYGAVATDSDSVALRARLIRDNGLKALCCAG